MWNVKCGSFESPDNSKSDNSEMNLEELPLHRMIVSTQASVIRPEVSYGSFLPTKIFRSDRSNGDDE